MKKICCLVLAILPLSAFAYPIDVEKQLNGLKIDYTTYATDYDMCSITLSNYGIPVGTHHRKEQLVNLAQGQRLLRNYCDLPFYPRINDQRLATYASDLLGEIPDIRITHIDGPTTCLVLCS